MADAKRAARAIIKTLTWADKASIITFTSRRITTMESKLVAADVVNRKRMNDFVDRIYADAGGGANYENVFAAAFNQMENSKAAGETTGCSSVILFLTASEITAGANTFS